MAPSRRAARENGGPWHCTAPDFRRWERKAQFRMMSDFARVARSIHAVFS